MPTRDHHSALRSDVVERVNAGRVAVALVKLQSGKDDVVFTLHVNTAGIQTREWLQLLGFRENAGCGFIGGLQCFSREVPEGYDLQNFATAFNDGFARLAKATGDFEACGFWLPFRRELSSRAQLYREPLSGDGHMVFDRKDMKTSEDDSFRYVFTFVNTGRDKGFVTHYIPRHPPLSSEVSAVFAYLGLKTYRECPEAEFEPCHYRTLRLFEGDNPFDGNVNFAHQSFDAHATRFSQAVEGLLAANAAAERAGLTFLPIAKPTERLRNDIVRQIGTPIEKKRKRPNPEMAFDAVMPSNFDVAISFAGTERNLAEQLAEKLRAAGIAVFYDNFYAEHLWGKNLTAFLDEIYGKKAKFCVVFVSKEYRDRKWTIHELRSAQAKALEQKGDEYILPVRVDDTPLDGLPSNVGYVDVAIGIDRIAEMLIAKLND
ncbi:TIR domain-containing protein [Bradyrhizobium sp. STM 3561]|uniref:TIR domain-containing protein n=1 Tax=Bradyrhizobium sp. STM 3561 TaxID=578923 RepID=UPI00388F549F